VLLSESQPSQWEQGPFRHSVFASGIWRRLQLIIPYQTPFRNLQCLICLLPWKQLLAYAQHLISVWLVPRPFIAARSLGLSCGQRLRAGLQGQHSGAGGSGSPHPPQLHTNVAGFVAHGVSATLCSDRHLPTQQPLLQAQARTAPAESPLMRVKCSSPAQSIDKTDGLEAGEGTASQSSLPRLGVRRAPLLAVVSPLPVFPEFPFHRFLFSPAPPAILSHPRHPHFSLAPSSHFSPFPIVFSHYSLPSLSFNFSLSLLLAPSRSPLSLSLCVSFSISDEGNENNRASLILSPVR